MASSLKSILTVWLLVITVGWLAACGRPPVTGMHEEPTPQAEQPPVVEVKSGDASVQEGVAQNPVKEPAPELRPAVHKVKWKHETLFTIALWYTGAGNNWRRLAETNPDIKPTQIRVGHTILIPNDLLKTRRPMPAHFKRPVAKKRATPPGKIEVPPLYGPIDKDSQPVAKEKNNVPVLLETLD